MNAYDAKFHETCEEIYRGTTAKLTKEITEQLHRSKQPPEHVWAPSEWWFSIYGTNSGHPKFWDSVVSNYYLVKKKTGQEWRVGIHFSPDQNKRCSGYIYGKDMEEIFRGLDKQEGFRSEIETTSKSTKKLSVQQSIRLPDNETVPVVTAKLVWLIEKTWPQIQALLARQRV